MNIRSYTAKDYPSLVRFMEELQDYLMNIDPLKRCRRLTDYGKTYTNNLLKEIKKSKGVIFLVEDKGKLIGIVAGEIKKQTKENLLECVPSKPGYIKELFVSKEYRSKGIGKLLMDHIENYFKKKNCTVVIINVLTANPAHQFYNDLGYKDNYTDVIKALK
ncbi:MAG: GNAT family N-acetyltransferase [Candidatus Nanoarchaeia archaeon]